MSDVPLDDVEALIELFASSDWTELHVALDDFELTLSSDAALERRTLETPPRPRAPAATSSIFAEDGEARDTAGLVAIRAPNLGHFYRAPKPGAPPFVEIGSRVGPDDVVCVIEVMKLFTLLPAGVSGVVRRISVADGAMVEFDQPLFYVAADS